LARCKSALGRVNSARRQTGQLTQQFIAIHNVGSIDVAAEGKPLVQTMIKVRNPCVCHHQIMSMQV
jgi:hypothetical protein